MKVFKKTFLIATLSNFSLAVIYSLVFPEGRPFIYNVIWDAIGAIGFGLIFTNIMPVWLNSRARKLDKQIIVELTAEETLIYEGSADHMKGWEHAGGKLVLSNQRLIFKSHKQNIQNHEEAFLLETVARVSETKVLSETASIITITLNDESTEKFAVSFPQQWIDNIHGQMKMI